ncbi:MAG: hypothetical protein AB7S38_40950 [Vulcanimicrobiota bacterium]
MSAFAFSPLFVIENALDQFLAEGLTPDGMLDALEAQYERVNGWLENLFKLQPSGLEQLDRMTEMGIEGNNLMLEALEWMHEATEEERLDELTEAAELLLAGHSLVEQSFEICNDIEAECILASIEDETY